MMRYGSVCSGIEAASVAWESLGWTPAWFSEIDPFPSAVLKARFPNVPNYGDFTKMIEPDHEVHRGEPIDLLVGGTPCQDFSVAGLRAGIEGARGQLTLSFLHLARILRPRWILWENVPGVLSANDGRAFGAFLGGLQELGYGFAWRVLDAQYVRVDGYPRAVPQRRRRVFVVGCAGGDWLRAASVLLEPEGVRGNPAPRREARKEAPSALGYGAAGGRGADGDLGGGGRDGGSGGGERDGGVEVHAREVAGTLDANYGKGPGERGGAEREYVAQSQFWNGADVAETLTCTSDDQRMPDKNRMQVVLQADERADERAEDRAEDRVSKSRTALPPRRSANHWETDCAAHPTLCRGGNSHPGQSLQDVLHGAGLVLDADPRGQAFGFQQRIARNGRGATGDIVNTLSAQSGGDAAPCVAQSVPLPETVQGMVVPYDLCQVTAPFNSQVRDAASPCHTLAKGNTHLAAVVSTVPMPACGGFYPTDGRDFLFVKDCSPSLKIGSGGASENPPGVIHPPASEASIEDTSVAFNGYQRTEGPVSWPIGASDGRKVEVGVRHGMVVRRLTPVECERLQGFPDGWTQIAWKGKPASDCPDGGRYKALGNSMAVNCMRWIGRRIVLVDEVFGELEAMTEEAGSET